MTIWSEILNIEKKSYKIKKKKKKNIKTETKKWKKVLNNGNVTLKKDETKKEENIETGIEKGTWRKKL